MKEDRSELYVGIFVFIGLAIIGGLVLRFSHFKDSFRKRRLFFGRKRP